VCRQQRNLLTMSTDPNRKPIVYACSGCSDAGELADRVARELMRQDVAEMSCLAGVAGRVKHLVAVAEDAERILVIDGCPINCARRTLVLAGVMHFEHLGLHELGFRKGSCPSTEERVASGARTAREMLVAAAASGHQKPERLPDSS
jgi:uncharacterized metal-binding protein